MIFTGLFDVGILAGAPVLGWVADHYGYPTMFRLAAMWVAVGLVSFALWDRDLRFPGRANYRRVTPDPYSPVNAAGDPVPEPGE